MIEKRVVDYNEHIRRGDLASTQSGDSFLVFLLFKSLTVNFYIVQKECQTLRQICKRLEENERKIKNLLSTSYTELLDLQELQRCLEETSLKEYLTLGAGEMTGHRVAPTQN